MISLQSHIRHLLALLLLLAAVGAEAHQGTALRRPITPSQPAWIIHLDVWNTPDPQKFIDMVPEDIRPYVIFNISTSSNDWLSPTGPGIYDAWMKVCAQNRVWTMIQCSSGAVNRLSDYNAKEYEQYFKDYPNFIGFNFAEQFWGFSEQNTAAEGTCTFLERLQLFADLLPVCHQYGGYLAVSFCDSYYNGDKMPIAYMKRNSDLRQFLASDPDHFLCFEKYTLKKNFLDIESNCLGAWLGGYAGQYGIRYDQCGWLTKDDVTDQTKGASDFVTAAGTIPIAEHVMLTGQTIIDGPELIREQCSYEAAETSTSDGYKRRNFAWFPQFDNISIDIFRKILDGTIRIMSREEVIDRTKVCIVNDIAANPSARNAEYAPYVTPEKLFDGLYRSDKDQGGAKDNHWLENRWWLKTTGRYPAIPQVYDLLDDAAQRLKTVRKSEYEARWGSISAKQEELNALFPQEYTGDIYAGRHENGWVTYNPYQYDESTSGGYRICAASTKRAQGEVPFQYNTCEKITFDYAPYSLGIMKEYASQLTLYLSNYQVSQSGNETVETLPVVDEIAVYGADRQPALTWRDRGNHQASNVSTEWADGVFRIKVSHNGPLDLTIDCAGEATGRKTDYTPASIEMPALPAVYTGVMQYEAEFADYKSAVCHKNGYYDGHSGYQGQGYAELTSAGSKLRDTVNVVSGGLYQLTLRYQAEDDAMLDVTCNDSTYSLKLEKSEEWKTVTALVELRDGAQPFYIQNGSAVKTFIDCSQWLEIKLARFDYDGATGEYHADLNDLIATGSVSFDPETGVATLKGGSAGDGSLALYFDDADFTPVLNIKVDYDGDGSVFKYLRITDRSGSSVSPRSSEGALWTSRYSLNYDDYRTSKATKHVARMEWAASEAGEDDQTMTIRDILIRVKVTSTGIGSVVSQSAGQGECYNLSGQRTDGARKGLYIVRDADGKFRKIMK